MQASGLWHANSRSYLFPDALVSVPVRIFNATWVENGGAEVRGELEITGGRLVLHPGLARAEAPSTSPNTFDAKGLLVFPGLVDPHVHFREPGALHKEGIDSGTRCALAGGVTTVLEMPNTVPTCSTQEALSHKSALYTQKSLVNWGLHYQATIEPQAAPNGPIASAKIYMAKSSVDGAVVDEEALVRIFTVFPRVAVHAEDETKFCNGILPAPGQRPDRMHHIVRPKEAITAALDKLERALRRVRRPPRLVLCHAGTREEVAWVKRLKREGFDVWAETCPHYFLLTQDDYIRIGNDLKVNPPLRAVDDRDAVLEGLSLGIIDFIATDHAPHTPAEKAQESAPSGIASIECVLPLLLEVVESKKLTRERLIDACVVKASACYGISRRDGIRDGNAADLVFLAPGAGPAGPVRTKAQTHPYLDTKFAHHVAATMVGGTFKFHAGAYPDTHPLPCVYST